MKKKSFSFPIRIVLVVFLFGCAQAVYVPPPEPEVINYYTLNEEKEARIGEPMLQSTTTTYSQKREWVGLLFSPDGWRRWNVVDQNLKHELIYSGKSGNTMRVTYRE